jgi:hypothetical protein
MADEGTPVLRTPNVTPPTLGEDLKPWIAGAEEVGNDPLLNDPVRV